MINGNGIAIDIKLYIYGFFFLFNRYPHETYINIHYQLSLRHFTILEAKLSV